MKAAHNKVILRYKKKDLDATRVTRSGLILATQFEPIKHVCTTAFIEADNSELNSVGFYKGDCVLVHYLVSYDQYDFDKREFIRSNPNFMYMDGEDEVRWCDYVVHLDEKQQNVGGDFYRHILGKKTKDGFMPSIGLVFCEKPEMKEERIGNIWIPDTAKTVVTDNAGFSTKIKYIHPQDSEEMGLQVGDEVICDKNSDAVRDVFGEQLIRVPRERVLAKKDSAYPIGLKVIA